MQASQLKRRVRAERLLFQRGKFFVSRFVAAYELYAFARALEPSILKLVGEHSAELA